jgi:hypothetical protein
VNRQSSPIHGNRKAILALKTYFAVFAGYIFFMAKAVCFKVRCTVCHEVFQNEYVGKHTKSKHKASGRQAPVTIELDNVNV